VSDTRAFTVPTCLPVHWPNGTSMCARHAVHRQRRLARHAPVSNPWVPSVHANVRFFHAGDIWWFGGGIDVTPYYPLAEQIVAFHDLLAALYQQHGADYQLHKATCDEYFYLPHRKEMRGVGGVFFDNLHLNGGNFSSTLQFVLALGRLVADVVRLFAVNQYRPFTRAMRDFQLYRRGRYVEFNLLFDRGTKFGIVSNGRTESILMSLPAVAHWAYNWSPRRRVDGDVPLRLLHCAAAVALRHGRRAPSAAESRARAAAVRALQAAR
jgi:coproporphyrinogen III oxidase